MTFHNTIQLPRSTTTKKSDVMLEEEKLRPVALSNLQYQIHFGSYSVKLTYQTFFF